MEPGVEQRRLREAEHPGVPAGARLQRRPINGASINPSAFEVVGDGIDSDCDGRDALRRYLSTSTFSSAEWTTSGAVTFVDYNMKVGAAISPASSAKRTFNTPRQRGGTGVMIDLEDAGFPPGTVTIGTGVGGGPTTYFSANTSVFPGTDWVEVAEVPVPHALRDVEISCPANTFVEIDWLVVQNADLVMPPAADISIDGHDTRTPGGGWSTGSVRDNANDTLYMATDMADVARLDSLSSDWRNAFGNGPDTLAAGGVLTISDVLPEPFGPGLYALVGDGERGGSGDADGGLWYSPNSGETWTMLGDSFSQAWDDDGDSVLDYPPEDDVAGLAFPSQCPKVANEAATTWTPHAGRELQVDWFTPGEVLYIANGDADAMGVSIYDAATGDICALDNTGTALPAEPINAVLRVDVEPLGTPVLLVGYDARLDDQPALYLCELPAAPSDCDPATAWAASCWAVPGSEGIDIRDLELDESTDETIVYISDAGFRLTDADNNGYADSTCSITDPGIDALYLDDSLGVDVIDYERVAGPAEMPSLANFELVGISIDPTSTYMFANVPVHASSPYANDRMWRVELASLGLGTPWATVNAGDGTLDDWVEDPREAIREANSDISASWLGQAIVGEPTVFPGRAAPGTGFDTDWLAAPGLPALDGLAVVTGKTNAWLVDGLAGTWADDGGAAGGAPDGVVDGEEETDWTFWPDVDTDERASYQTMGVLEVAVTPGGEIFQAVGDHGLVYLDPASTPQSSASPNAGEVDCLWYDAFRAGGNGVDVGLDGSVWVALRDQTVTASDPYPHDGGILRWADTGAGWEWRFAAGGYLDSSLAPVFEMDLAAQPEYRRLCHDHLTTTSRSIDAMDIQQWSPFSWGEASILDPSFGNPREVRPLDATTAVALFRPTDATTTETTAGGIYVTLSGGVDYTMSDQLGWVPLPFDGDYTIGSTSGTCDESTTWEYGLVQLIHPGTDTYANDLDDDGIVDDLDLDGYPDDFLLDLLVTVSANDTTKINDGGRYYSPCAMARVLVGPDGVGGLDATWEWIPLEWHYEPFLANECGVWGRNITGASVSPWSNEAYIYGAYYRDPPAGSPVTGFRGGGACVLNLDTYATTMLVSPAEHEYSIAEVIPHPQVTDFVAILPTLNRVTWLQCGHSRAGWSSYYPGTCSYPWPLLAERMGNAWNVTELDTQPPTGLLDNGAWSEIGLAVGEEDESWLVVGTNGSGAWRGVLEW